MIAASVIAEVVSMLHAASAADLVNWTEAELYGYMNRQLQFAHARANYLTQVQTLAGFSAATANLAADQVSIIEVVWNGKVLLRRTVSQMDSLSATWETDMEDEPVAAIYEQQGSSIIRLSPIPALAGTLEIVYRATAPTLAAVNSLAVPQCVDVIVTLRTLADANLKDGRWQFEESASFANALADIMESAAKIYYGEAA